MVFQTLRKKQFRSAHALEMKKKAFSPSSNEPVHIVGPLNFVTLLAVLCAVRHHGEGLSGGAAAVYAVAIKRVVVHEISEGTIAATTALKKNLE
jgi:hypothetical protein